MFDFDMYCRFIYLSIHSHSVDLISSDMCNWKSTWQILEIHWNPCWAQELSIVSWKSMCCCHFCSFWSYLDWFVGLLMKWILLWILKKRASLKIKGNFVRFTYKLAVSFWGFETFVCSVHICLVKWLLDYSILSLVSTFWGWKTWNHFKKAV